MTAEKPDIVNKTFMFGIEIVKLVIRIDNLKISRLLSQIIASGTSIGANVEEAQSASSRKDFINKMTIALREAKETRYWLRIFYATEILTRDSLEPIMKECLEIVKILITIIKNSKSNSKL